MADVHVLEPLSLAQFNQKYHKDIRLTISWKNLKDAPTGLSVLTETENLFLLGKRECTIRGCGLGEWYPIKPGNEDVIMRVPTIKYGKNYLLLDGNHRVQFFEPSTIIMDYIDPGYFHLLNYVDQGLSFVESCRRV